MRFSDLDRKTVGVWGAGREILSLATQIDRLLPSAHIGVIALDASPAIDVRALLHAPDARIVIGEDVTAGLASCDVVVRSPGVSIHRPELSQLRAAGIPITTATGLWLSERRGRNVIGITGTKGKSTTAALMFHLARAAEWSVHLAGNIGYPALDLIDVPLADVAIVELSSYQIADLETGPEVVVLTNLYREHVDWHGSEAAYREEKTRIVHLPGVRAVVVNARDKELSETTRDVSERWSFGSSDGWDISPAGVTKNDRLVLLSSDYPLRGKHNALNLCAALTALEVFGIECPPLPQTLRSFNALPHRLEVIADRDGVLWVDDSISTVPESAIAAIESFPERAIVLLGGGQDRGQDYFPLAHVLAQRGAAVIGMPTTGGRLVAAARSAGVPLARAIEVECMEAAVAQARELARPGSVVLLSPAAPSYDSYGSFEERGDHFRALAADISKASSAR